MWEVFHRGRRAQVKPGDNLKGWQALVEFDGELRVVDIVTHIRGPIWLVEGQDLPRRFERHRGCRRTTVTEDRLLLTAPPD
jgi:hypothetical protein